MLDSRAREQTIQAIRILSFAEFTQIKRVVENPQYDQIFQISAPVYSP